MNTARARAFSPSPPSFREQPAQAVDRLLQQAEEADIRLTPGMAEGLANGNPRMIAYVADLIAVRGIHPAIETRHDGGPLEPGETYTVNEDGPEAVIKSNGDVSGIGDGSPALVMAGHAGMVLPAAASGGPGGSMVRAQASHPVAGAAADGTVYDTVWHGRFDGQGRKIWDVVRPDPVHGLKTPDHPDMNFETLGTPEHPFEMGVDVDGAPNAYPPHKLVGQFGGPNPAKPGEPRTETITEPLPGFPRPGQSEQCLCEKRKETSLALKQVLRVP